jgi:hypothetical protein
MRIPGLAILLVGALLWAGKGLTAERPADRSVPSPASSITNVGIEEDRLTVNGAPRFLLGVSYFDIQHWRLSDLDGLAARKFNLIRVWLDWLAERQPSRSMFDATGTLPPGNQRLILELVRACASRGIVVEVVILQAASRIPAPEAAFRNAVKLLRREPNVIFDLVNEHNNRPWSASHRRMAQLMKVAKEEASDKVMFYSSWEPHLLSEDAARLQRGAINDELASGVMVLAPHLLRTPDWAQQTASRVQALKQYLASVGKVIPVYLSEENRRGYQDSSAEQFRLAARQAYEAGAAAWIFHTQAGFDLSEKDFFGRLDPVERDVIETLARP